MPRVKKQNVRPLRPHFLRQWRKYRNLSQEEAAAKLDIDRTTLGRVENRRLPYSQALLEAAAEIYGCEPWDILNINPKVEKEAAQIAALVKRAKPEERAAIIGYAQGRVEASEE